MGSRMVLERAGGGRGGGGFGVAVKVFKVLSQGRFVRFVEQIFEDLFLAGLRVGLVAPFSDVNKMLALLFENLGIISTSP